MQIQEVSWVNRPANATPFLFFKNDGDVEKKDISLDVSFSTKGAQDDTSLVINGTTIQAPRSFSLYYSPVGDNDTTLSCEYSTTSKGVSNKGFRGYRTYRMSKNLKLVEEPDGTSPQGEMELADEKDLEILKSFVPDTDEEIDGSLAKGLAEQIEIIKVYEDDMPGDLVSAVKAVVKLATEVEDDIDEEIVMDKDVAGSVLDEDKIVSRITEKVKEEVANTVTTRVVEALRDEKKAEAEAEANRATERAELEEKIRAEVKEEMAAVTKPTDEELEEVDVNELTTEALAEEVAEGATSETE